MFCSLDSEKSPRMVPGAACPASVDAQHGAPHGDRVASLPDHRHDRSRSDETDERLEERLADVLGVVALGKGAVDAQGLKAAQSEATPLEAADDLADEAQPQRRRA